MNFGEALEALLNGKMVQREGWNGKGMFLRLVHAHDGDPSRIPTWPVRSYIELKDATDWLVPWLASQTDILARDWKIYEYGALLPVPDPR